MHSLRYLNTILTILAVLLSVQLWTSWNTATDPTTSQQAFGPRAAYASGIPNAGAQRKQIVDLLKKQVQQTEALADMFKSGQARVRVERRAKDD